jgi:hypothetical protein
MLNQKLPNKENSKTKFLLQNSNQHLERIPFLLKVQSVKEEELFQVHSMSPALPDTKNRKTLQEETKTKPTMHSYL